MAATLPVLGGILTVSAKLGGYLVPTINRQFNYMCCYASNVNDVRDQVAKLIKIEVGIQHLVQYARRNLEIIGPDVKDWLEEVESIKKEAAELLESTEKASKCCCIYESCLNLKVRYLLSRRAKKMTKRAVQLKDSGRFVRVSYPPPPLGMPIESENRFMSRKYIEDKLVATLQDGSAKMVGLCGMGGVGKTTMVKRIGKILQERKVFDEVVMAVVTQHPDAKKIQNEIANMLGLRLEEGSTFIRGHRLLTSILDNAKRVLIILDDVWEKLDLGILGISFGPFDTCKILFTSRARDICDQMGAEEIFQLQVLSDEEAWILFSEEAGISNDSPNYKISREVADECKGLPIALISVARALRRKSESSWKNALTELQRSIPTNITGVITNVYRPLELSYHNLEGEEAKKLFLLCSLFRQDSNIDIEDLVRYGIGLAMFNGIKNIREGRDRVHALVETLKDRFLLGDGHKQGYVRMHDVVRDVAISIACKDKHLFLINHGDTMGGWLDRNSYPHCTHASLYSNDTSLPIEVDCPNLLFLVWECKKLKLIESERTFEKFEKLNVAVICYMDIPALPSSIRKLTNLRTLHLSCCKLENISIIGELVNLEILCLQGSDLKILPAEVGNLVNLRLLDVTGCDNLEIIEEGVIKRLVRLEEIYLANNISAWCGAGLSELEQLPNLTTLRILIAGRELISKNLELCTNLTEYDISIRAISQSSQCYPNQKISMPPYTRCFKKAMHLLLPTDTKLGNWVTLLLQKTEDLRLNGDGSKKIVHELGSESFQHVKQLGIQDCATLKHLVMTINKDSSVFPRLETLYLHKLPSIKVICSGQLPANSFRELRYLHLQTLPKLEHFCSKPIRNISLSNLKSMYIYGCHNLKYLLSVSVAESLLQLEELEIANCQMMKTVFFDERGKDGSTVNNIEFPKLEELRLRCLHRITDFCTESDRISFPQLNILKMEDLPQFNGFCPTNRSPSSLPGHHIHSAILFNENVSCPKLKTLFLRRLTRVSRIFCHQLPPCFLPDLEFLEVVACHRLNTIFSSSIAHNLVKLKVLRIKSCSELVEVIEKENGVDNSGLFRQLKDMKVDDCDRLKTIFPAAVVQGLVKLQGLWITNCKMLFEVIERDDREPQVYDPFPQLKRLQLSNLPNIRNFWHTDYELKIPSLWDVIVDTCSSQLKETLAKVAKNSKQKIANRSLRKLEEEQASHNYITEHGSYENTQSASTAYESATSHICQHEEERWNGEIQNAR